MPLLLTVSYSDPSGVSSRLHPVEIAKPSKGELVSYYEERDVHLFYYIPTERHRTASLGDNI